MRIFVTIDASSRITGVYGEGVSLSIPAGALLISDADGATIRQAQCLGDYTLVNSTLVLDAASQAARLLSVARDAQIAALAKACAATIVSGFTSSALGAAHTYPSQPNDQSNLIGAVTASQSPGLAAGWTVNFWCSDTAGAWVFAAHTPAQIQQVLADGVVQRVAYSNRLATLKAQVAAAATIAAVQAIVW